MFTRKSCTENLFEEKRMKGENRNKGELMRATGANALYTRNVSTSISAFYKHEQRGCIFHEKTMT